MKIRHSTSGGDEKVELQMTPMIDIVFQLLVFFVMTFRIVSQEGDFNIKMPLAAPREGLPDDTQLPPIKVQLSAYENGEIKSIALNEKGISSFPGLNYEIAGIIGEDDSLKETTEVELECDYHLKYEYVIEAITAVSGYIDDRGEVIKLVEKIKFAPPKPEPGQ